MADRYFKGETKTLEGGVVKLFGSFVIGAAGAIASQACKGFSVAKVGGELGRYKVTLEDSYNKLLNANVSVVGAADAGYGGTAGLIALLRNVSPNTKPASFEVQLAAVTGADAEPALDSEVLLEITLKNSTAY